MAGDAGIAILGLAVLYMLSKKNGITPINGLPFIPKITNGIPPETASGLEGIVETPAEAEEYGGGGGGARNGAVPVVVKKAIVKKPSIFRPYRERAPSPSLISYRAFVEFPEKPLKVTRGIYRIE